MVFPAHPGLARSALRPCDTAFSGWTGVEEKQKASKAADAFVACMPWGKKDKDAPEEDPATSPGLNRTCHICERSVDSRVWYARTVEEGKRKHKHDKRVYACPSCYFELPDDGREGYFRERL